MEISIDLTFKKNFKLTLKNIQIDNYQKMYGGKPTTLNTFSYFI